MDWPSLTTPTLDDGDGRDVEDLPMDSVPRNARLQQLSTSGAPQLQKGSLGEKAAVLHVLLEVAVRRSTLKRQRVVTHQTSTADRSYLHPSSQNPIRSRSASPRKSLVPQEIRGTWRSRRGERLLCCTLSGG